MKLDTGENDRSEAGERGPSGAVDSTARKTEPDSPIPALPQRG